MKFKLDHAGRIALMRSQASAKHSCASAALGRTRKARPITLTRAQYEANKKDEA